MTRKCKICPFTATGSSSWDALKRHWEDEHPSEHRQIARWLAEIDTKLELTERPALEGMKGYK
jgi:hypothetical protein